MRTDNIYRITSDVQGVNPAKANSTVRRFLQRDLVQPADVVAAILVSEDGCNSKELPVVHEGKLPSVARSIASLGIRAVKIFASVQKKDRSAASSHNASGLHLRAIRAIKKAEPSLCVITDTCLCSFTPGGDCVLRAKNGSCDVDATYKVLLQQIALQIEAGADVIGPATMLDGLVREIRMKFGATLPIMPHLTWRSSLFRPYRSLMATGGGHQRQAFQIDPSRPDLHHQMAASMVAEGATMLMCQPGLFSLDMVHFTKLLTNVPVGIYSVSGEYVMFSRLGRSASDFFDILYEHATASKRCGADFLVTYAWKELLTGKKRFLKQ
jgi:porphobilinogen synthase